MTTAGNELRPIRITVAHLKAANIGEDYWETDFDTYQGPVTAKVQAYDYLENLKSNKTKGLGLLLAGKPGTGKTSLLAIILKYLTRANWTVYMVTLSELIEEIKRSWNEEVPRNIIEHCKQVDFLGIDDVGKEHQGVTGFSGVTFDNLLRHRAQHRKPTFFTTNLTRNHLGNKYGDATLSLIEGKTRVVSVQGEDYRQTVLKPEINAAR